MSTSQLVIKGAYYYDNDSDTILIPHFTGQYAIVDCSKYVKMEELKGRYSDSYIDHVKDNPIEYNGEQYYDAEYSPWTVGDWELLSDLSELAHLEHDYNF